MAPSLLDACRHIADAIDQIEAFVVGLDDEAIIRDQMRLRAIERCLQIITEAARHIPADARTRHPEIDWDAMVAMGNILRHEYFQINSDTIIRVVRHDLGRLKTAVHNLRR